MDRSSRKSSQGRGGAEQPAGRSRAARGGAGQSSPRGGAKQPAERSRAGSKQPVGLLIRKQSFYLNIKKSLNPKNGEGGGSIWGVIEEEGRGGAVVSHGTALTLKYI